jgi:peptide/nickel transport system substrate-binding protein
MKKRLTRVLILAAAAFLLAPAFVGAIPEVPRDRTLVLGWSIASPIGVTNPWAVPGYTHQEGNNFMWEPLYYFSIFADKEVPWLADSMKYTRKDFTELTIKINKLAAWSDGTPVTSKDVLFTFKGQLENEKLPYHGQFAEFVKDMKAPDNRTVILTFKQPSPRFMFEVLELKFDTGIPIVPAHVLAAQADVNAFPGGLDMPHSGPYTIVNWDKNQKILDLREDWWAVKAGLIKTPDVKRIVMVNLGGQIGQNMDLVAQLIVNNEMDCALDMRSALISSILRQNATVTTHSGNQPPYGYLDWWPNSLWVNTKLAPYSDPRVRRAMSLSIDRNKINEIVYEGAKIATIYPFPLYPGLQKFADSAAVKALERKYQPGRFDLAECARLMGEGRQDRLRRHQRLRGHPQRHRARAGGDAANRRVRFFRQLRQRRLPEHGGREGRLLHVGPRRKPEGPVRGPRALPRQVQRRAGHHRGQQPLVTLQQSRV